MDEEHELCFQGVWLPNYVFDALEQKKIKAVDIALLCVVEAHTQPDTGCSCDYVFLERYLGEPPADIIASISRLLDAALVVNVRGAGDNEYLVTRWGVGL